MRIVTENCMKSFPLEQTALFIRTKIVNEEVIYVLTAMFSGKEFDLGYYKSLEFAQETMYEINTYPEYMEEQDEDGEWFTNECTCVTVPMNDNEEGEIQNAGI